MFVAVVVLPRMVTSTGIAQVGLGDAADRAGMVAENSATWRSAGVFLQDALDVVDEAHAQHFVGFVEHQQLEFGQSSVPRSR
jgi:hypothetical protein